MKKIISLIMAAFVAISVVGCASAPKSKYKTQDELILEANRNEAYLQAIKPEQKEGFGTLMLIGVGNLNANILSSKVYEIVDGEALFLGDTYRYNSKTIIYLKEGKHTILMKSGVMSELIIEIKQDKNYLFKTVKSEKTFFGFWQAVEFKQVSNISNSFKETISAAESTKAQNLGVSNPEIYSEYMSLKERNVGEPELYRLNIASSYGK